jgi:UDP-N-acetylglucosamine--N-acetylmuramyl-(pentapeptide) pyrophosphoryl-undecaprenol N-acetylglucosamine transferase
MTYVIAGGGTGGHVFPAIAVADAIKDADPKAEILFIGTARGLEDTAVPKAGYKLERIVVTGIKGRSIFFETQRVLSTAAGDAALCAPPATI